MKAPGSGTLCSCFAEKAKRGGRGSSVDVLGSALGAAEREATQWMHSLRTAPIPFTNVDRLTMHRAGLVAAALTKRAKGRPRTAVSLEKALQETARGE